MGRASRGEAPASPPDADAAQASVPTPAEGSTPPTDATEEPARPVHLVVTQPYGFIDDHGDRWHWNVGDTVRNPFVVGMLLERAAPVQEV